MTVISRIHNLAIRLLLRRGLVEALVSTLPLTALIGCTLTLSAPDPAVSTSEAITPFTQAATPTLQLPATDTGAVPSEPPVNWAASQPGEWHSVAPGLEQRVDIPEGETQAQVAMLRIDPAQVTFRAHYRAGEPLDFEGWREALPDAAAFINANFFTPEDTALGLLITDGAVVGTPFTDRGGLFTIDDAGLPHIRSTAVEPYTGEPLQQAVQAFPMLVEEGTPVYTETRGDRITRRTAVAIDDQGRVLWVITPLLGMRLAELAAFLADGDYGIVDALNLDGGGSTMMSIRSSDVSYTVYSLDPVPTVLAIYPR